MAAERIYCVKAKDGQQRLVRASHPSTALTHVAKATFDVAVATQNDLELLLGKGVKVENIKAEQQELPD